MRQLQFLQKSLSLQSTELIVMKALVKYLKYVKDERQEHKVKHKIYDIIMLVFLAKLSNADEWTEFEVYGKNHF